MPSAKKYRTLSEIRRNAGLTQKQLADRSGLRQATISALEAGASRPHRATLVALSEALNMSTQQISMALANARQEGPNSGVPTTFKWAFLDGLDGDLKTGLQEELVSHWTHHSTALEGNTISQGDTLFVLRDGLTVNGHSLREHQEVYGHAGAISLFDRALRGQVRIGAEFCHECHRLIQTGSTVDALAPVGKWKIQNNGTTAITTRGKSVWHDYAGPENISKLMQQWLETLVQAFSASKDMNPRQLTSAYTDLHLGFVLIHPYADGNGRMARLLSNLPLLAAGHPPLLIANESRRDYLRFLGDFTIMRGAPTPGERLVPEHPTVGRLRRFFQQQWRPTQDLVETFRRRQANRTKPRSPSAQNLK